MGWWNKKKRAADRELISTIFGYSVVFEDSFTDPISISPPKKVAEMARIRKKTSHFHYKNSNRISAREHGIHAPNENPTKCDRINGTPKN
jgi:hypothetical protein